MIELVNFLVNKEHGASAKPAKAAGKK